MHEEEPCYLVKVTTPDIESARHIADVVVEGRLAACATLVPGVESRYWWEGKVRNSAEVILFLKTTGRFLEPLQREVLSIHRYQTPEFVVLPIASGNPEYLDWVRSECVGKRAD